MIQRRNSQIARLPKEVRELVNQMLDDGATQPQVAGWGAEHGHGEFNDMVISRWKNGGFQDWLLARERRERYEHKHELAQEQAATGDSTYHDAGMNIVAQEFYDALHRLNFEQLAAKAREKPDSLLKLLAAFIRFNRYALQRDKFRHELFREHKADYAKDKPREPVTEENLEMLCEKFGLK